MHTLICSYCKIEFERDKRHINEMQKLGRRPYCSLKCLGNSRKQKRISLVCENPICRKTIERTKAELSNHNFCSISCSAKISNLSREKKIRICANKDCSKTFTGDRKYCSFNCIPLIKSKYTRSQILTRIQNFVKEQDRIPTKRDFVDIYVRVRKIFGSWNNAIETAGFEPNPVLFAKKYLAKDGHKCDSLAEKIIDDFLSRKQIDHERNIPYGINNMTADFKIDDIYIEFIGLQGVVKKYDKNLTIKKTLWKEKGLKVMEIYPKDLFPKNKLDQIFKSFVTITL